MWLEDKEDEEEEELLTYLLSTLTEAQVLSILANGDVKPKDKFSTTKTQTPFFQKSEIFLPLFEDNQESSSPSRSLSDVIWSGLPSSGWMGALQVRGGKANIVPCSD